MPKRFMPLLDSDETFLPAATAAASLAGLSMETLNSRCFCIGLDSDELHKALESTLGLPGLFDLVQQCCPHLFAAHPGHRDAPAAQVRFAQLCLRRRGAMGGGFAPVYPGPNPRT